MEDEDFNFIKNAPVFVSQQVSNKYTLYMNDRISTIDQFVDHISVYENALPEDIIFLHVSSPGGSTAVGEQLCFLMNNCPATIVGVVGMGAASMASAILLNCDDLILTDMSTLLVHSFGYGNQSHSPGMFSCADFNNKLNVKWVDKYFGDFLTPEERADILKGVDLLFDADQIQERWERIMELRHGVEDSLEEDENFKEIGLDTPSTTH